MKDEKRNRALLTGTITYAIGSFGTKFLSFLIVPLYTYYITPDALGDYDLLTTTVSLISPLLTMKISEATYRWIINNKENEVPYISATYKLLLFNSLIISLILVGINLIIPIWNCYYFIAILIGDRILECLQKLLRGLKNQKLFALSGLFHTGVMVGCNLIKVCILNQGVEALLQSNVISLYSTIILILILEKRLWKIDFKPNYRKQQTEMLRYSAPLVPSALSWWIMNASDRYLIRWIIGSTANGIYSVAYKFPSVISTLFTMFNNAWTDMALAQLNKGEKSEQYSKKLFQKLYQVSFSAVFVLIPLTKIIMKVILSESYKEAAVYVGFLYLGSVFQGFSTFCNIGYLYGKKTSGAAKTSAIGAVVNISVDLICIYFIGLFAASISTFLGFFVMWLVRMKDIKDTFPIKIDIRVFAPYLAVGVLMAVVTIWTSNYVDLCLSLVMIVFFFASNRTTLLDIIGSLRNK